MAARESVEYLPKTYNSAGLEGKVKKRSSRPETCTKAKRSELDDHRRSGRIRPIRRGRGEGAA